jgi:hypothetical protein
MKVDYRIDTQRGIVYSIAGPSVHLDYALDHQSRLQEDPDFKPDFDQLCDLTQIVDFEISGEGIRELARADFFNSESKRAFVAVSDVVYGSARMFQMIRDSGAEQIEVFREMEEARHWLGLD